MQLLKNISPVSRDRRTFLKLPSSVGAPFQGHLPNPLGLPAEAELGKKKKSGVVAGDSCWGARPPLVAHR